jgi:hypothetical protein
MHCLISALQGSKKFIASTIDPFDILTGSQAPFGTFTGPGILDLGNGKARFYPDQAGIGGPYPITYTYIDNNACSGTYTDSTSVIDIPQLSVSGLEPSYCIDATPDTIVGNFEPMGSFSGPGIIDLNIGKTIFDPSLAGVGGPYTILIPTPILMDVLMKYLSK